MKQERWAADGFGLVHYWGVMHAYTSEMANTDGRHICTCGFSGGLLSRALWVSVFYLWFPGPGSTYRLFSSKQITAGSNKTSTLQQFLELLQKRRGALSGFFGYIFCYIIHVYILRWIKWQSHTSQTLFIWQALTQKFPVDFGSWIQLWICLLGLRLLGSNILVTKWSISTFLKHSSLNYCIIMYFARWNK